VSTYSADDLRQLLDIHHRWLNGEDGGQRADLRDADLSRANLSWAYLSGADLSGAHLSGADLSRANLSWADLSGADLSGSHLSGADLSRADLSGAYLSGANLSGQPIRYASCSWTSHGERGRTLHGIASPNEAGVLHVTLSCGCFRGSLDELREYIARGEERYRASRTIALEFILSRMAEMGVAPTMRGAELESAGGAL